MQPALASHQSALGTKLSEQCRLISNDYLVQIVTNSCCLQVAAFLAGAAAMLPYVAVAALRLIAVYIFLEPSLSETRISSAAQTSVQGWLSFWGATCQSDSTFWTDVVKIILISWTHTQKGILRSCIVMWENIMTSFELPSIPLCQALSLVLGFAGLVAPVVEVC